MIVGFDLGTATGVAWLMEYHSNPPGRDRKTITSETWNLPKQDNARMYHQFRIHLRAAFEKTKPNLVIYEEPCTRMSKAWAAIFYGLRAILLCECEARQIPWVPIHPSECKKYAGMSGTAKKADVQMFALHRWPDMPRRQDEMDARFIALAGLHVM